MKVLSIILSIYIFLLAIVPCSDVHHEDSENETQEVVEQHDQSRDCDDDSCTPFCSCSCCQTDVVVIKMVIYHSSMIEVVNDLIVNLYTEPSSTSHYNTLFRPPIS